MKLYRDMTPMQKRISDRKHATGQQDQKAMAELGQPARAGGSRRI